MILDNRGQQLKPSIAIKKGTFSLFQMVLSHRLSNNEFDSQQYSSLVHEHLLGLNSLSSFANLNQLSIKNRKIYQKNVKTHMHVKF